MFSFKSFRRKCLFRLMTVLGFGGMVGFCITSCQSHLEQKESERVRHEVTKYGIEEPHTQSQTTEIDQTQPLKPGFPKKYGIIPPSDTPDPPSDNSDVQNPVGISPDEIKESLNELNKIIQSTCHPEAGTLKMTFLVQSSGIIKNVKSTDGTLKGTEREQCILKQISKYHFKKFEGSDIPIKYTFKFK